MKQLFTLFAAIIFSMSLHAQVGINTTGAAPDASAMLDVKSSNKGVLITRLSTAERLAIVNPAMGLMVFDTTERTLYMYDGNQWLGFAPLTELQRPANNYQYGPAETTDTTLAGYSVSIWDQYAAIGVPYRKTGNIFTGGVYIYKNVGGLWQYQNTIVPANAVNGSYFGLAVNLRGNYLAVGATGQTDVSNNVVGAVYIYYFNGTGWQPVQTIYGTTTDSDFGSVVSINQLGNYVAISEPNATVSGLDRCGTVRIYYKPGASYVLQYSLQDPSPVAYEYFGTRMAMSPSGLYALVSAPNKTVSGHFNNGYIGQFKRVSSTWSQQNTYTPISEDNLKIGEQVDITDNYALFSVGKTNEYDYLSPLNGFWGGYQAAPLADHIDAVSLDPITDEAYLFAGKNIYSATSSSASKVKAFSIDNASFSLPNNFSVYNKNYVIGFPYGTIAAKIYKGAFYFGVSPQ